MNLLFSRKFPELPLITNQDIFFPFSAQRIVSGTVVATLRPEMIKPEDAAEMQGWKMGRIWIINNISVIFWISQLLIFLPSGFLLYEITKSWLFKQVELKFSVI